MAARIISKRELLDRWRDIEEEESLPTNPVKQRQIQKLKEKWFPDAFNFLTCLPKETHIWCSYWDLMGSLLETFHNYYNDNSDDSPLKSLWKRISQELRQCTQCICQHHQAQEMYNMEFESEAVSPLLGILRTLDEERVTVLLKEINARITGSEYNPENHKAEVVSVMFEVLMFPSLLDDQSLVNEFQTFIEAIDNSHELTLAGHQQYPGVYALLFLKSERVRSIGLRLAGHMGKLRNASDLEPVQPLLKKCIGFLETEVLSSTVDTSRPRVQLERITVWLGVKALLGFLEPPAFEEGILERYPIFLSIVLNYVSDDTPEFTHAVTCLRLLFEILGCKLWLRTTFSPGVMRNTLLGQCFHTRSEKSHKEIFDLFQPFLQSLEALQDGEHERQRRHFLYFLLHQVPHSSNFSFLMRKKARKIALLIIDRGYKMNPPCPPFECAHMWGPSLMCSLKDSSLHNSLRQPAFDLIQTIIVSDASALISLKFKNLALRCSDVTTSTGLVDDEDELAFSQDVEDSESSCWTEFSVQSKPTSRDCREWMCVPMLWFEVLVEMGPSSLPVTFSKAVIWALSRFSVTEPGDNMDKGLSAGDWSSYPVEIAASFGWEVPNGSDDGGDGKESKNSCKASASYSPLIRTFKRCAAYFVVQMNQGELWKQWTWEPRMAESLILLIVDPNDDVRQFDRVVLEHVSNSRGLSSGLQYLCSSDASISAVLLGLRYALKLVLVDSISNFNNLHHLLFVIRKLLEEVVGFSQKLTSNAKDSSSSKFLFEGGFLRHALPRPSPATVSGSSSNTMGIKSWDKFCYLLSGVTWPSILKFLAEGKVFLDSKIYQMACVRLLEIVPVIFERLKLSELKLSDDLEIMVPGFLDFKWLHDLIDWGKSSLVIINKHWKESLLSLLSLFKGLCHDYPLYVIGSIETLISLEPIKINELKELVSQISVSLSMDATRFCKSKDLKAEPLPFESLSLGRKLKEKTEIKVIVLSDDESDKVASPEVTVLSSSQSSLPVIPGRGIQSMEPQRKTVSINLSKILPETDWPQDIIRDAGIPSQKWDSNAQENIRPSLESSSLPGGKPPSLIDLKCSEGKTQIQELVCEPIGDPLELAASAAGRLQSLTTKLGVVPKRQLIQLEMPMEHKAGYINRQNGGVKRFKPPRLDDWYRPILEINFFSIVGLSSANNDEIACATTLKEVPQSFLSAEHYMEIFRPLVLEEFKAQLNSSYIEASSLEEMCCGSLSIVSVERIDDFHIIRCIPNDSDYAASRGCSENDLVLLAKHPLQNAAQNVHMVGKVERRDKDHKSRSIILVIRFYLQNGCLRFNKARKLLIERSKWYVSRIMSITPQLREFQALSSLNDIPILPIILNPLGCSPRYAEPRKVELGKLSQPLQRKLKVSFNESQLQAISIALETRGAGKDFELSLIQGPPGTGKTRTIVAIVSALLALGPMPAIDVSRALGRSYSKPNSTTISSSNARASQSVAIARAWQDALLARQLVKEGDNGSVGQTECSMRGRILICAQSNAAVDELVLRLSSEGLYGSDGQMYKPYLVRVGNPKTVHPNSLPFFIDTLVEQRIAEEKMNESDAKNDASLNSLMALRSKLEKMMDNIRFYESQRANLRDGNLAKECSSEDGAPKDGDEKEISEAALGAKLNSLYAQKKAIYTDLAAAQAREKRSFEESKFLRHQLRKAILKEAEVVVTTLSGCGSDIYAACTESLSSNRHGKLSEDSLFDAVLIDEAAQALEPATLIPLQLLKSYGTKCIMVGDPKQLPATVLSNVASKYLFQCSMFERLQKAGYPVTMLAEQYRMHPEICLFPSLHFYDNKLLNGVLSNSKSALFHENLFLRPYMFFDVVDGHEHRGKSSGAQSLSNESETDASVEVLRFFKTRYSSEFHPGKIGIISPYRSQVSLLRSRFTKEFGPDVTSDMEFNTVDGFQGREVDILILSTVRASEPDGKAPETNARSIGFVADVRRMNVALTRAKFSLWIVGNKRTLRTNPHWDALLGNAEERKLVVPLARPYGSIFRKFTYKRNDNSTKLDFPPKECGKVKNITQSVEHPREVKETSGRKVKHGHSGLEKHPSRGTNERCQKKSAACDFSPGVSEPDLRPLKDVLSTVGENCTETNSGADGSKISKGSFHSERSMVGDSSQRKSSGQPCSILGSNRQTEASTGSQVPSGGKAPKSLIESRKRQRDAVDALLSSALIPSKKPESSSKAATVKRPPSPSASRGTIKPPKQFKAPNPLTRQLQETTNQSLPPHPRNTIEHSASGIDLNQEWECFKKLVHDRKRK